MTFDLYLTLYANINLKGIIRPKYKTWNYKTYRRKKCVIWGKAKNQKHDLQKKK